VTLGPIVSQIINNLDQPSLTKYPRLAEEVQPGDLFVSVIFDDEAVPCRPALDVPSFQRASAAPRRSAAYAFCR
jgi:hypothetical protein